MDKRFLGILAALVIIFIGIFAISQHSNNKSSGNGSTSNSSQPTSHIEGLGQKHVTLVEYGDYQCPICELYYQPLKQVAAQFSNDIYFQFRNLPLSPNPHPNAFTAARAAEAAGLQNKYWEMHDKLYERQNEWAGAPNPQSFFNQYAQEIGLNLNQFKQDFISSKVNNAVDADLAAFAKTGKDKATPTFFLDGQYLSNTDVADNNGPNVQKFAQVINAEIAKKTANNKY